MPSTVFKDYTLGTMFIQLLGFMINDYLSELYPSFLFTIYDSLHHHILTHKPTKIPSFKAKCKFCLFTVY